MPISRFVWTEHAALRLAQRRLARADIEDAIRSAHDRREVNDGRAQWRLQGVTTDGVRFEVIYDHPHRLDPEAVRIVSEWRLIEDDMQDI